MDKIINLNFMFDERQAPEFGSDISHLVEGMKDEHVNEASGLRHDTEVDQAPEGMNAKILHFREKLASADLSKQEDVEELNGIIAEVAAENEAQAETLKEEFLAKKIA